MPHQFKEFGFPEVRRKNPIRHGQLELNNILRNQHEVKSRDWGKLMVTIPPLDWAVLQVRFPELVSPDHEIMKKAWGVFMAHPASEPYRVKHKNKARKRWPR